MRTPEGKAKLSSEDLDAGLSPILAIVSGAAYDQGQYNQELLLEGIPHNVQLILRQPEKDTLTMDIQLQKVGSLQIRRFALIYKKSKVPSGPALAAKKKDLTRVVSK